MKIWISYFYQIRNFEPNMIPFSTAQYDPKWYHKFENNSKIFVDQRGVINGLRLPELVFPKEAYEHLLEKGLGCGQECVLKNNVEYQLKQNKLKNDWQNFGCVFMNKYFDYLWNNVDFDKLMDKLEDFCDKFKHTYPDLDEPEIVLIVHEPPSNPCAERPVLIRYFEEFGVTVEEWNPYE